MFMCETLSVTGTLFDLQSAGNGVFEIDESGGASGGFHCWFNIFG